jgi:predicted PurR-regulated permease PerM
LVRSDDGAPSHQSVSLTKSASQTRVALQILFIVAAVALSLWLLQRLATVVVLLVLSTLVAYVIAPLVHIVRRPIRIGGRRRVLPRGLAIALIYLLIAGAIWLAGALVLPKVTEQVEDVIAGAPAYTQSILAW